MLDLGARDRSLIIGRDYAGINNQQSPGANERKSMPTALSEPLTSSRGPEETTIVQFSPTRSQKSWHRNQQVSSHPRLLQGKPQGQNPGSGRCPGEKRHHGHYRPCNNVKSTHNKKHAARKAAKSQAAGATTTTAKKPGVSKTQAVKDFYKANPKASNQEAVDALAKEGITISTNYISNIKSNRKKRRNVVKAAVAKGEIGIPEIKAALTFIKSVGSVAAAKQAIAAAEEIRKIV